MATIINGDGIVTAEGTSTTQGRLRLGEDTDNGSNYVELQAPASVASNITFTLPSADGTNGQVLQTNGSGALSFTTISAPSPLSLAATTTVAAAATTTIDCSLGSVFNITWGTSITTLSFTNVPASPQATQLQLVFKKDTSATQYTVAWPSSISWQNNTPPSTNVNPNSVITVTLTTIDGGTKWRGSFQTIEGYAGTLWAWGRNNQYQLGDGTPTDKSSPVQIGSLATWVSISSFQETGGSFAITSDGVINGAGTQNASQFGLPSPSSTLTTYIYMAPVASGLRATAISGSNNHQIAIDLEGKLWGWGFTQYLGLGQSAQYVSAPMIVNSGTWIDISNSGENSFAVRSDGTVWATGRGSEGALGQGNTTSLSYWVQVGTDTNWASIAAGSDTQAHVLALKNNGTLWSWGFNSQGQLGLGNITNRSSPVQVGTDTNWAQISAATLHSAAVKSDGTLWTWGYNISGQLGVGDTTNRSSPTQVGALTTWRQVCCAYYSTFAIKTDGTLWAWGQNGSGQLGVGNTVDRSSPVQVGAATDWLWLPKRLTLTSMLAIRGTATNP